MRPLHRPPPLPPLDLPPQGWSAEWQNEIAIFGRLLDLRNSSAMAARALPLHFIALVLRKKPQVLEHRLRLENWVHPVTLKPPPTWPLKVGTDEGTPWTTLEEELYPRLIAAKESTDERWIVLSHKHIGYVLNKTKNSINGKTQKIGWSAFLAREERGTEWPAYLQRLTYP